MQVRFHLAGDGSDHFPILVEEVYGIPANWLRDGEVVVVKGVKEQLEGVVLSEVVLQRCGQ